MVRKSILLVGGIIFIIIGIAGLLLPFLPGTIFLIMGIIMLSRVNSTMKKLLLYLKEKLPHHHQEQFNKLKDKLPEK